MTLPLAVSAAFDQIYPGGLGFPEALGEQGGGVTIASPAEYGVKPIAEIFPGSSYGGDFDPTIFAASTSFTDNLVPLYRSLAHRYALPCALVKIERCLTLGSVILVGEGTPVPLYETWRPNDRAAIPILPADIMPASAEDIGGDGEELLFLESAGSANYGHFLVDDLPRLAAAPVIRWHHPHSSIRIVMVAHGDRIDAVRRAAIGALAPDASVMFLRGDRPYRFGRLWYASPVSYHPICKNPSALGSVCAALARLTADPRVTLGERIYVARRPGPNRNLLNQRQVLDVMTSLGFAIVVPEDHAFREQLGLFRHARLVVGQMGAGMTNTLAAESDATILHLAPEGWVEPFYWDLAVARGQRYRVLYGTGSDDPQPHRRDFTIDIDQLRTAVSALR